MYKYCIDQAMTKETIILILPVSRQTALRKHCRPRSDTTKYSIWSRFTLFATHIVVEPILKATCIQQSPVLKDPIKSKSESLPVLSKHLSSANTFWLSHKCLLNIGLTADLQVACFFAHCKKWAHFFTRETTFVTSLLSCTSSHFWNRV